MNLASCMKVAANQLNVKMEDSVLESSSIDQIVNIECDFRTKYSNINFFYLLESNVQSQEGLLQLSSALHILIKYGCNLVRPVPLRPLGWQRILFSNRIFKERVDIIKGSQNILKKLGYKKESTDGLSYEEPEDPSQVPMIVVELMGSRSEIEKYLNREHPYPYLIDNILKSNMIDSNESKHTECDICGGAATLFCDRCEDKPLCESCEKRWHSHSQRKFHKCRSLQQRRMDCEEFTELSNQLSTKKDVMAKLITEVPVFPFNSIQGNQIWNGARPKSPALKTDENRKPSNNFLSDPPGGGDVNQTSKSRSRKEFHASTPKKLNEENWKWVCDHCTFINCCATETTKKICESCCRTSDYPMTYLEHRSDDKSDDEFHDCSEEFSFEGDSRRKSFESGKYSSNEKSNSSIYSIDREPFKSRILDEYDEIEHEKREAKALFEAKEEEISVKSLDSTRSPNCHSSAEPSSLEQTRLSDEHEPKRHSTLVEMERLRREGYSVIQALKEAERRGFDDDEFSCILHMSKDTLPLEFIKNQWTANIAKVREDLVKQNVLYVEWMTDQFIRSSLTSCDGDVEKAAVVCRERWKEKLESLLPSGDCSAGLEEAVAYLVQYNGDFEMARDCLIRDTFLGRIWNSDEHSLAYDEDDIYQMPRRRLDENLIQRLKDDSIHYEARVRSILVEADLMGWQRAENVIALLHDSSFEGEIALMDVVDAVGTYGNLDRCIQYLQQECPICFRKFPHREIQTLACCSCTMCRECIKQHFDIAIREKHVRDFICPLCQMPDIDTIENAEQTHLHFQFLYMLLKPPFLSDETHAIFQQKLCEWNLKMQPGFIWCAFDDCQNGFLVENANQNKVACTQCHRYMCKDCRKEWADQHRGITCEAFEEWTRNNDPEYQNQGLARHLDEHGIECPQCRSPYSLSKGGCMHFKCLQCRHEFCEGCYQPMKRENTCQLYAGCARMGMHCHHPRDCLYYLRDNSVAQLQQLLQGRGITTYDTLDPSVEHQDGCRIMIQNVGATTKDEPCGKPTPQNYAGLCECHYKEYLVALINRNNIDPLPIMTSEDMMQVLRRAELPIPIKMNNESDEQYCDKLKEAILNRIPLPERKKKGTRNIV